LDLISSLDVKFVPSISKLSGQFRSRRDTMTTGARYRIPVGIVVAIVWLACLSGVKAQQTAIGPAALAPVPRLVWFSGAFRPAAAVESVTLAVYADQEGGDALWQESQNVVVGADGRFNLLMGATSSDGLPLDLFTSGAPRWLGVQFNRAGEKEQPRVQLASVP